jgi:hypothetical protein
MFHCKSLEVKKMCLKGNMKRSAKEKTSSSSVVHGFAPAVGQGGDLLKGRHKSRFSSSPADVSCLSNMGRAPDSNVVWRQDRLTPVRWQRR